MTARTSIVATGFVAIWVSLSSSSVIRGQETPPKSSTEQSADSSTEPTTTQTSLLQPAPAVPAPAAVAPRRVLPQASSRQFAAQAPPQRDLLTSIFGESDANSRRRRLARVPDMFGDSFYHGGALTAFESDGGITSLQAVSDLALAGGARRLKIAENNKALPVDRVYVDYNYFKNSLNTFAADGLFPPVVLNESRSVHRYTFGWEKTVADGNFSFELRMPFTGDQGLHLLPDPGKPDSRFDQSIGNIGNLSVILKALLYDNEVIAISSGLGVEAPTGSDVRTRVYFTQYELENEAVYLSPFIGVLAAPSDDFFWNAFAQVDVATGGNTLNFRDATATVGTPPSGTYGRLDDQTLLYLDFSSGYWLYHGQSSASWLTGVAVLGEVHYTTALQDTDVVAGARIPGAALSVSTADLRSLGNRVDVVNVTAGLHLELWHDTALRVAGVVPLRDGHNRFFDAELIAQLTRRF